MVRKDANETPILSGTPYVATGIVGEGRTGVVYRAVHLGEGTICAVKLLGPEYADRTELVQQMQYEAQALGRLAHPNILAPVEVGQTARGRPFVVTEELRGRTLRADLPCRGLVTLKEAVRWTRTVLSTVAAAHEIGLIHGGIRLQRLILHHPPMGPPILKVLGFGRVSAVEKSDALISGPLTPVTLVTRLARRATGSTESVSPRLPPPSWATDAARSSGSIDPSSPRGVTAPAERSPSEDLYATGVVLYALLASTGHWQRRATPRGERPLIAGTGPPSGEATDPVQPELEAIALKAVDPDPARSFASIAEFDQALANLELRLRHGSRFRGE
jgi:serine/threonine protein kinase